MNRMLKAVAAAVVLVSAGVAKATVLYSGAALPSAEGWTTLFSPVGNGGVTQLSPGVQLDTTATSFIQGGFAYDTPTGMLSAATGFRVSFTSAVLSESHSDASRAGFSAIIVTDSLLGIEFDFHADQILAQDVNFTSPQTVAYNTSVLTTYDVDVLGSVYTLSANGVTLLTGSLQSYVTSSNVEAQQFYAVPGSLFFGDNSQRGAAVSQLTNVTAVPEPVGAMSLAGLAVPAMLRRRR